jgi:hypothetical protein
MAIDVAFDFSTSLYDIAMTGVVISWFAMTYSVEALSFQLT